nr:4155_t:CDS:2 [Entrophospora candida]
MVEKSNESDDKTIVANENDLNKDPSFISLEDQNIDRSIEKKLLRKLDMRIIPLFTLTYLFNTMEKVNIGNAKIAGLTADTGISEPDYNNALSLFYIGIILFDVPSCFVNKKIGINIWYPIIMVGWALCSLLQAFVTNAGQLQALRFLLGVFESGAPPIQLYYYTVWYTPNELSIRAAIGFACSIISGAFEGLPPFILAAIFYFVIPQDPNHAKFLTKEEVSVAYKRLQIQAAPKKLPSDLIKKQVFSAFTDYKIYLFAIVALANGLLFNSVLLFTPTIIKEMGFDSIKSQALSAPPFVLAAIALSFNTWLSNRNNDRGFHIIGPDLIAAIVFVSWMATNIAGQYKRAVGLAIISTVGEVGGVIAGQIYRPDSVLRGHVIMISFLCLHIILVSSVKFILTKLNKKKDLLQKINNNNNDNKDENFEEKYNEELLDNHPNWRYLI